MSVNTFFKKIFSVPMILLYILVYAFRFELMIIALSTYSQYFSAGKAFNERLLGEFYFSQAQHADLQAKAHFNQSLLLYLQRLKTVTDPAEKGRIEALIGSQYECGKGMPTDFKMAKQWYQSAIQHGNIDAKQALQNLEAHIIESNGQAKTSQQCAAILK